MRRRSTPPLMAVLHRVATVQILPLIMMLSHLNVKNLNVGRSLSLPTTTTVPLFVSSFSLDSLHTLHHSHNQHNQQMKIERRTRTRRIPLQQFQWQLFSTSSPSNSSSSSSNSSSSTTPNTNTNPNTQTASYLEKSLSGYKPPSVNWYPGHIAKAERTLSETLSSADVLLEIRDARIPKSTSHPRVREWTVGKPRIVVFTKVDMVPKSSVREWEKSLQNFGAGRWDGFVEDGNLRHAARQNMKTRGLDVDVRRDRGGGRNGNGNANSNGNRNSGMDEGGLVEDVIYVDAKRGSGMPALLRAIGRAGGYVNEKRLTRGLRERPLRVAVLGYPNVGKSALINRILGRRRAKSANTPGITRSLQWIRVRGDLDGTDVNGRSRKSKTKAHGKSKLTTRAGDFELLDSPGIIPANMENQEDAILLAICNSIGTGAYDNQGVAAYLCERLKTLYMMGVERTTAPVWREKSVERYGFDPLKPVVVPTLDTDRGEAETRIPTGEDMLFQVAENTCRGDPENAARKILQDFRNGRMGPVCLQLAPEIEDEEDNRRTGAGTSPDDFDGGGERFVAVRREIATLGEKTNFVQGEETQQDSDEERRARAEIAMKAAKDRGLELPPIVEDQIQLQDDEDNVTKESEVGKGLFDGW